MTTASVEHCIPRAGHHLYARDYPGSEPATLLLHGFPDNLHLYDALVPYLIKAGRRVITFDFLGWGQSDKPLDYIYTHTNLTGDLDAVIRYFELDGVVLVAHDASGPPAIDWALDHAEEIAGLVLLNTYYYVMPTLRAPEAIFGFSLPFGPGKLFQWMMEQGDLYHRLYEYQVGHFIRDPQQRAHFVPLLYQQMEGPRAVSSRNAFYQLNDDLIWTNIERQRRVPELRRFERPVRIIFGTGDQYLNEGVARTFHKVLPSSELFLLPDGWHFVQIDEAPRVAQLILEMPLAETSRVEIPATRAKRPSLLPYQLMYLLFGLMTIFFAPLFLWDRWRLYQRVQAVFQAEHSREKV